MVIVSCSTKFHSFALAEQLQRHELLRGLYTTYAYQKNVSFRKLAKRIDKEQISPNLIHTNIPLAIGIKLIKSDYKWNEVFDRWVASKIKRRKDAKLFIGWSGMSLNSIIAAKRAGKVTILERGSAHILTQNSIYAEEYKKHGINFSIDQRVIEKEIKEYEQADIISIPSSYAKNSFIEYGISESKLFQNPYGTGSLFKPGNKQETKKFVILYLGLIGIPKGIVYMWEALKLLSIPKDQFEVWLIGNVEPALVPLIDQYKEVNWKFLGHINHYSLGKYLNECDVAIQPSLQEGLSMVIAQLLSSGIPVIATENTGGMDIIKNEETGFIVPIRSAKSIAEKVMHLYNNPSLLAEMKVKASHSIQNGFTWNQYGDRYAEKIKSLIQ